MSDHQECVESALKIAEGVCETRNLRFTPLRKQVLTLVWEHNKPVGAYNILEQLTISGKKPAPPTVYRALEFLLKEGFVHRIASLNAFVACPMAGRPHVSQFLICDKCGRAEEVHDKRVNGLVYQSANSKGFKPSKQLLEVHGVCEGCAG